MSDEEDKPAKKEEEIFGFPISRLGALTGALALLGVAALGWHVLRPQLPNLQQQQLQQQQQPAQQAPQQTDVDIEEQVPVQQGYAVEQDPFTGRRQRQRVPEVESQTQAADYSIGNVG